MTLTALFDVLSNSINPILSLNFPTDGDILEPGKQYNITWIGVLVPSIVIVLTNMTDDTTSVLAITENTGTYYWELPLSHDIVGQYQLSLFAAMDKELETETVTFSIQEPVFSGEPSITLQDFNRSYISEGDSVTIQYTSEVNC